MLSRLGRVISLVGVFFFIFIILDSKISFRILINSGDNSSSPELVLYPFAHRFTNIPVAYIKVKHFLKFSFYFLIEILCFWEFFTLLKNIFNFILFLVVLIVIF